MATPAVVLYRSKSKGLRLQTGLTALTEIKGVSGAHTTPADLAETEGVLTWLGMIYR